MVGVAQSVERQVVALDAAGSSPVTHPILKIYLSNDYRELEIIPISFFHFGVNLV